MGLMIGKDSETRRNRRKAVNSNTTERKVEHRWWGVDLCPPWICATKQLRNCMSLTEVPDREDGRMGWQKMRDKATAPWLDQMVSWHALIIHPLASLSFSIESTIQDSEEVRAS